MSAIGPIIDNYEAAKQAEKEKNYLLAARYYRICSLFYENGELPMYDSQVEEYGTNSYSSYLSCRAKLLDEAQQMLTSEMKDFYKRKRDGSIDWRKFIDEEYDRIMSEHGKPSPNRVMKNGAVKKISRLLLILVALVILLIMLCNWLVQNNAEGRLYKDVSAVPKHEVGLLLGTTPQTRIGRRNNQFFQHRIEATVDLYRMGKISRILVSGDENSLDGINEVQCMRDSLVAHGVNAGDIILDGKGFRTYDSVVRAVKVYNIHSFVIISQKFHNERAMYLAEHLGLDTHDIAGYNAKDSESELAFLTYIREYLARVKLFIDIILK